MISPLEDASANSGCGKGWCSCCYIDSMNFTPSTNSASKHGWRNLLPTREDLYGLLIGDVVDSWNRIARAAWLAGTHVAYRFACAFILFAAWPFVEGLLWKWSAKTNVADLIAAAQGRVEWLIASTMAVHIAVVIAFIWFAVRLIDSLLANSR